MNKGGRVRARIGCAPPSVSSERANARDGAEKRQNEIDREGSASVKKRQIAARGGKPSQRELGRRHGRLVWLWQQKFEKKEDGGLKARKIKFGGGGGTNRPLNLGQKVVAFPVAG